MKKLNEYIKKRNFEETAEPIGKKSTKEGKNVPIFVVQHHLARKDHFDFRLQFDGVLISFAVPKGPSYNPSHKRLAVHVEDHPLDYANFEGTIPKGQYGGGTVMLWDTGTYEQTNNFQKGLKEGSLKFVLYGQRLFGKWTLVKLKEENEDNWLMIKENDEFVKTDDGISHFVTSIKTGRTMQEIESDEDLTTKKNPFQKVDVKLCTMVKKIPTGKNFVFEIKYDGFRMVCFCEKGKVNLLSRNHIDFTRKFVEIAEEISKLSKSRAFVFDGEIVALDKDCKPDFQALQNHLKFGSNAQIVFMIFDLLALDGQDLRSLPLLERKEKLKELLKNFDSVLLQFCEHFEGDGQKFFEAVKQMQLEGIVCKKKSSVYDGRRNETWLKCKCYLRQEFVVCGFLRSEKKELSALLLGVFENNKLKYVGKCGTGFDERTSKKLLKLFKKNTTKICPFQNNPITKKSDQVFWMKTRFVCDVQFAQVTKDGVLRQASFKGLREDKNAKEVVWEISKNSENHEKTQNKGQKQQNNQQKSLKKENLVCGIEISNPQKIVYKDCKISKLEIVKYYEKVAKRMLVYMKSRLLSVVRCHGKLEDCFFKKHPTSENFAQKIFLDKNDDYEYFFVEDEKGLIEQVQFGTLEFHLWGSHVKTLEKPDYMVFDLDPDEKLSLNKVREGVKDLKKVLDSLKLKSFLKTSGGKGYHVVVPFSPSVDWKIFHDFSENVAKLMENKWPEKYTTNIRKDTRKGKIFIDFLRNTKGATSVAPYSLRARKGAKVSMPIAWSELEKVAPDGIDMKQALLLLSKKNPWQDFDKVKQSLKNKN